MPMQPPWYSEGIATFLETITYDRKSGRAEIGEPSKGRNRGARGLNRIPARRLLGVAREPSGEDLARFEDSAWLLVHYLINKRPRDFARLQAELGRLKTTTEAWPEVFPDLPPEKLDSELDSYGGGGKYAAGELAVSVPAPAIAVRVMTDAEAHATRALLFETAAAPGVAPDHESAKREIAAALEADASNVDALAMRYFWFTPREAPEGADVARRATAAHPDSWLAWLMTANTALDNRAQRTALSKALALEQNQAIVLSAFARLNAASARWQEALSFSTKAMHVGERSLTLLGLHMRALAHVGNCHDAAFFVDALQTIAPPEMAEQARGDWAALQQLCADAARTASQGARPEPEAASP
jgi:Tfp pilus assembly protein PilF